MSAKFGLMIAGTSVWITSVSYNLFSDDLTISSTTSTADAASWPLDRARAERMAGFISSRFFVCEIRELPRRENQ